MVVNLSGEKLQEVFYKYYSINTTIILLKLYDYKYDVEVLADPAVPVYILFLHFFRVVY